MKLRFQINQNKDNIYDEIILISKGKNYTCLRNKRKLILLRTKLKGTHSVIFRGPYSK